ncbi:phage terminase small subunit P27 family [Clostridium tunisiense]|uniref:phage terminase small subunit P27 family n=1 Tax=Clostridium tunisiense TaxID=219748 RepID=UPI000304047C|nr:phage terminase small subunit P27 family [Clostridium tunisiense]
MKDKITCPSWMDSEAKKEWKRIIKIVETENKEITAKDLKTLEAYCMNYSKWKECENILRKKGYTFTTPNGYEQQRPEVSISNKAQERMVTCAKELGLTPAARARANKSITSGGEPKTEEEKQMEGLIS